VHLRGLAWAGEGGDFPKLLLLMLKEDETLELKTFCD